MGTIQSTHLQQQQGRIFPQHNCEINQSDFRIIANYSYTQHIDPYYSSNYTVLAHKQKSFLQMEKYELFFNTYEEYKTYEEIYTWRNKSKYLVQAKAIKEKPANRLCGTFHQATLFLQRIPIRACEITDIPIQEGLYLLYTSFLGFRKIYQRTGYFDISLDMICINKDSLVKVWLNSNLSKIYPELYSINQNLTQTNFIQKILSICEPLIDFDPIQQKFSDFLKCCYFPTDQTPRKQENNKFCKYSKIKQQQSNQMGSKKSLNASNASILTFDKIIEYFEGYLSKHNLVIAREMKSIRDLFRIQQKIEFNQENMPVNNKLRQSKGAGKQKVEPLQFMNDSRQIIPNTRRKNSKRINYRKKTDRSSTDNVGGLFSYKSEEYMRNVKQYKEPQYAAKRPPSVSFGYHPLARSDYQQLFSPQHISSNKTYYLQGRQRIKTTIGQSISFTIGNQIKDIENVWSPNKSYRSNERYFYKNKARSDMVEINSDDKDLKNGILLIESQVKPSHQIKLLNDEQNIKEKPVEIIQTRRQQRNSVSQQDTNNKNKKTICYTVEEEWSIDEDIAKDLNLLEKLQGS